MKKNRRAFVSASAAGLGLMMATGRLSAAPKLAVDAALAHLIQGRPIEDARVTVDIPPLVENGNLVVMQVTVQSPMTPSDYIRSIHVIAEGNPLPEVIAAHFTDRSGRAAFSARIRLANSQRVWAIAQTNHGKLYRGSAETVVTLAACTEGI